MALTRQYLLSIKNLAEILKAIRDGQAPERFTTRHLANLGFKSPADRLVIGVMKGLGFLTDNGVPTPRYVQYLDSTQSPRVMRQALEEAYSDLFKIRRDAFNYSVGEVRNKIKTLTEGKLSDAVLANMARTFLALCKEADFSGPPAAPTAPPEESATEAGVPEPPAQELSPGPQSPGKLPQLVYNIQVILPTTKDRAVYDAVFRSLKEHLLR